MENKGSSHSDISKLLGESERTCRYWRSLGLVGPPEIKQGRKRLFSEKQVEEYKAIQRLTKKHGVSIDELKALKASIGAVYGHMEDAGEYPFSTLVEVLDRVSKRDFVNPRDLVQRMVKGSQFLHPPKAEVPLIFRNGEIFELDPEDSSSHSLASGSFTWDRMEEFFQGPTQYRHDNTPKRNKRKADFIRKLVDEGILYPPRYRSEEHLCYSVNDYALGDAWKRLINRLGEVQPRLLIQLKKAIERDMSKTLPYPPVSGAKPLDKSLMNVDVFKTVLEHISDEISTLNLLNYPDRDESMSFVHKYIEGFYFVIPSYPSSPVSYFRGRPQLAKTPITELNPQQLRKAEELEVYTAGEVEAEAERRIEQCREDIKFLRYRLLKNLKRRKK